MTQLNPHYLDTSAQNPVRLTYNEIFDLNPKWSFDGKKIAWISGNSQSEISIMNSDGSNQEKLTDGSYPSWAPDNKRIVYSKPTNSKITLFIINIDTRVIKQITF